VAEARALPQTGAIGCEPYVNGMAKILRRSRRYNIGNIRLFAGDAAEIAAWARRNPMRRIDLIHPDPWPKRRHWKRRFVQDFDGCGDGPHPQGRRRYLRRDIDDYCAWTLSHLLRSPDFFWTAERASDWQAPWPDYTMTRYGAKAEREGRKATYLRFRRAS
jgi:tRNA (guanine-N7-)-methyltransferase